MEKKPRHFTDSNSATRRIFYEKSIGGRVYVSPFQKFSSPHTSPFESSSSVPTYSRMLFGNENFPSRTLMDLESVYNSLFTDSFKMTGTLIMTTSETRTSNRTGFYETNNNSARASRFFVHFFAFTARLRRASNRLLDAKIPNFTFKLEAGRLLFFFSNVFVVVAVVVAIGVPKQ